MAVEPTLIEMNRSELAHLTRVAQALTAEQLAQPLDAGWTVSGVLAHLAFWDLRALTLIDRWASGGAGPSPMDTDVVNEAMRALLVAIEPRAAAALTVDTARKIDAAIAGLTPQQVEDIQTNGTAVHLNRAHHWAMHLGDIEQALGLG